MLEIKSVQLTRPPLGGPDEIVVVVVTPSGEVLDLFTDVPRGMGEAFVNKLGVLTYRHVEHTFEQQGRRKRLDQYDNPVEPVESE